MSKEIKKTSSSSTPKFSLAFITGANSGIGAALCRLLANQGIPLMVTARDPVRLQELVDELQKLVKVIPFLADLKEPAGRQTAIDQIHTHKPDLVINNAGFGLYGEALSYDTRSQLDILEVDAKAVLELTLEAARTMIGSNKNGTILNVSSAASQLIFPCFAVYSASKAFVNHVSQSLDYEFAPYGINVLTSCPGVIETSFRSRASGMHAHPSKRMAMSAEYAANIMWKQIVKGKRLVIFDWKTRWGIRLSKCLPKKWLAKLLSSEVESYHPPRPLITTPRLPRHEKLTFK